MGIIQHRQHGHQGGHLHRGEIIPALDGGHRDALLRQSPAIGRSYRVAGAQQDGDVPILQGSWPRRAGDGAAAVHQLPDLPGHPGGLPGGLIRAVLILAAGCLHQGQLRHRHLPRIAGAVLQAGGFVIIHVPQATGHAQREHCVGPFQDLPAGAEVLPQQDAPGLAGGGSLMVCVT